MQVVGVNVVVTLPGYRYAVTYYKPEGSTGLIMKHSVADDDLRLQMTGAEFTVTAWRRANAKARELGWIG